MKIIPEPIIFDWDIGNCDKNFHKHHVSMQEAEEVFVNEPLKILDDTTHSKKEKRYVVLGKTNNRRILFISFTLRKNKVRIISARDMDKKEKNYYEEV